MQTPCLGGGWAQGRQKGSNTFFIWKFYGMFLKIDILLTLIMSTIHQVRLQELMLIPIFRAGINIALFQGKIKAMRTSKGEVVTSNPENYSSL